MDRDSTYSWSLPIDANHDTKYKIKHDGKILADIWINHNGIITCIKNYSKHFCVLTEEVDEIVHRRCHVFGPPVIIVMENHHHHHHHKY